MPSEIVPIPGTDLPRRLPTDHRRTWLRRRVAASTEAVDALISLALGELPPDAIDWPTPAWAGVVREPAHA